MYFLNVINYFYCAFLLVKLFMYRTYCIPTSCFHFIQVTVREDLAVEVFHMCFLIIVNLV